MSKRAFIQHSSSLSFFCSTGMTPTSLARSVTPAEIAQFSARAQEWWSPNGDFRALHELNPLRLEYIKAQLGGSVKGKSILDVGCGGGLMSEALAREGAKVTGLDASSPSIDVAREHAALSGLQIDYRVASAEGLAQGDEKFDAIVALEIVEHVADLKSFMAALGALLKPEGRLIVATLNRTKRSFLLAVVAAEYLLGWVPAGTHDWERFIRPSELAEVWGQNGIQPLDCTGMVYKPFLRRFSLCQGRAAVNYFMTGKKEKRPSKP